MSGACLIEASARELADLVRNRTVSAVEVIEAFLAEVERKNPHLNAIIRCDPQKARTEAEAADRRLAQGDPAPLRAGSGFLNRLDKWSLCLTAARMAAE